MKEIQEEINAILEKHKVHLEVEFVKETVMGNAVLIYKVIIVENPK